MLSNNKNEISSSHVIEVGSVPIQLKSQQVQIWDRSHGSNPNSSHVLDLLGHCPSWAMYPNEATEPQHSAILLNSILKIPQNVNWQKCLPNFLSPHHFLNPILRSTLVCEKDTTYCSSFTTAQRMKNQCQKHMQHENLASDMTQRLVFHNTFKNINLCIHPSILNRGRT